MTEFLEEMTRTSVVVAPAIVCFIFAVSGLCEAWYRWRSSKCVTCGVLGLHTLRGKCLDCRRRTCQVCGRCDEHVLYGECADCRH